MTERQWAFFRTQGESARRAGIKAAANPYAGKPSQRDAESAWTQGWESEDDTRRRK